MFHGRPLPADMVYYARQDTRHLIYLYTRLKNELISRGNAESNLLHATLHQSNDICKKRYYKPALHPDSHLEMVRKARTTLNNKQLFCLKVGSYPTSILHRSIIYYPHPGAVLLAGQAGAGGGRVCAVRAAQPHDAEGGHGAAAGDAGDPRLLQPRAAPRQAAPRHHPPGGAGRQVRRFISYEGRSVII